MRTSFHHQPEARHPIFSAIYKLAGRITPSFGAKRTMHRPWLYWLPSLLTPSGHQARPQSFRTTRAGFDHRWFLLDHSELRPLPIGNSARDLCRRLVGDREYRTDVDLAKHVAVGPVGAGRAEHEVRVPDHR